MKKFLILLLSVILILSITACTSNEKNGEEKTSEEIIDIENSSENTINIEEIIPEKSYEIIYIDENNNVYKEEKIREENSNLDTADLILQHLGLDNDMLSYVDREEDIVKIDFNSDILLLNNIEEKKVLDSLSLTFILVEGYDSVYFTINKENYQSENITLVDNFYISKDILQNNWDELYNNKLE